MIYNLAFQKYYWFISLSLSRTYTKKKIFFQLSSLFILNIFLEIRLIYLKELFSYKFTWRIIRLKNSEADKSEFSEYTSL